MDVTTLLRRVALGDSVALRALFDLTIERALLAAHARVDDTSAAESIAQEAYVLLWHRARDFDAAGVGAFNAVVLCVRFNAVRFAWQKSPRSSVVSEDVEQMFAALPKEASTLLQLAYVERLHDAELARRCGRTPSEVSGRLRAALRAFSGEAGSRVESHSGGAADEPRGLRGENDAG